MSKFSENLRFLRKREHMTQPELGQKLGVSRSTISMYELGSREPDFEMLEAIADVFNVDMNMLTGSEAKNQPDNELFEAISDIFNIDISLLIENDTKIESSLPNSGIELSEAKRKLMKRIFTLSDSQVDRFDRIADIVLEKGSK